MKLWTCTEFSGHWPVGTAAIVLAYDVNDACLLLERQLKKHGLPQKINPEMLKLVQMGLSQAIVLKDGNY